MLIKITFTVCLFILSACSVDRLLVQNEINKVFVANHTPYMQHNGAFFSRTELRSIEGKKYIYLYNEKKHALAMLLHPHDTYLLYTLSSPIDDVVSFEKYTHVIHYLQSHHYKILKHPEQKGFIVTVLPRIYKGIKTIFVEVKDYRKLLLLYREAIRNYNASTIQNISTKLPQALIYAYYKKYQARANKKQLQQINLIAKKLGFRTYDAMAKKKGTRQNRIQKPTIIVHDKNISTEINTPKVIANIEKGIEQNITLEPLKKATKRKRVHHHKPYAYYLHKASLATLSRYLASEKKVLTDVEYSALLKRKKSLKEEKIYHEGSLAQLIATYKKNHKERFKQRILERMKEKQQ